MKVPFNDLTLPTAQIRDQYLIKVAEILDKGHFVLSEEVTKFEQEWATYVGTKYAVGVSNGGDALYLSLLAAGVGPGDEVITQGNAYNASVTAILRTGAVPRFVDIDPNTLEMDVSKLEAAVRPKTKAILPVHLYGLANDMETICNIANKHELMVIEDCAQAHGATWNGKKVGSFGFCGAFSFYPTKNLGAFGDAGAVTTNNEEVYNKLLRLRNLGQAKKNDHQDLGFNMRLDPLQAAALSLKLKFLDENNKKRAEAAEYYKTQLSLSTNVSLLTQTIPSAANHVYHLLVVLHEERDEVIDALKKQGIETGVYYPVPVFRQPFYQLPVIDDCSETDEACERILALPLYPGISKEQQDFVIQALKQFIN